MATEFMRVGTDPNNLASIPAPDEWGWGLQDVSSSDAGRVQDANATMYKMRLTQKRKLAPVWKNRDAATVAAVLGAFQPEYVFVLYHDALENAYVVREFYTGDKSATMRKFYVGGIEYSSLSFSIIER